MNVLSLLHVDLSVWVHVQIYYTYISSIVMSGIHKYPVGTVMYLSPQNWYGSHQMYSFFHFYPWRCTRYIRGEIQKDRANRHVFKINNLNFHISVKCCDFKRREYWPKKPKCKKLKSGQFPSVSKEVTSHKSSLIKYNIHTNISYCLWKYFSFNCTAVVPNTIQHVCKAFRLPI